VDLNLPMDICIFVTITRTFEDKFGVNPYFWVNVNVINWTPSIFFFFLFRQVNVLVKKCKADSMHGSEGKCIEGFGVKT
jgi:hypothetical protein